MVCLNSCIFKRRQNIRLFEAGIVFKDFFVRSPCTQQAQHIGDADPKATNTWASAAFSRFDSDSIKSTGFHDSSK